MELTDIIYNQQNYIILQYILERNMKWNEN